jgi:hypothetical protein
MPQGPIPVRVTNSAAIGNSWFVNETTGSDTNPGTAVLPFKSLAKAQSSAVALNNDVVYLYGSCHLTATLNWAKNGVSLVGLSAPSDNARARIAPQSVANGLTQAQATALTPMVNVTAQGCSFVNISAFYGFDGSTITPPTSSVCWAENGGRNFYSNVQFLGGGDVLMAALAGMRSLTIGSDENLFIGCTVGLDTVQRITAVNASLEFLAGTSSEPARNTLRECIFQSWSGLTTNLHCLVTVLDRYALFDRCSFFNAINSGGGSTFAVAFTIVSGVHGSVLLQDCASVGSTVYATSGTIYVTGPVPTGNTSGLAVAAT